MTTLAKPLLTFEPPSRVRYGVLAMLCGLSMITYLDRACFGAAAKSLVIDLNLKGTQDLKWAFTTFALAYGLFEIPCGWLGDRLGPRGTIIRIVIWWSICTSLTAVIGLNLGGLANGWVNLVGWVNLLVLLRFLFGAGEAGAYPNITRALHNWFPPTQWERVQGMIWMSGRLMGGLTPLVWALLVEGTSFSPSLTSWRGAFVLFGLLGLAWCLLFGVTFRNRPEEHPAVNAAERWLIEGAAIEKSVDYRAAAHQVPWLLFLQNRSLWALCGMYFLINYGWIFNLTYLPAYLEDRFVLPSNSVWGAIYKGAPLWVGAIGCVTGGFVASFLGRAWGDRHRARQVLGACSLAICAACWWGALQATSVLGFCGCISLAAFCIDMTLGACWASCQDLGQRHAAVTAAWMNTVGTAGSALAGWLTGRMVEWSIAGAAAKAHVAVEVLSKEAKTTASLAGFEQVFTTYMAVYLVAAACWLLVNTRIPIDPADAQA